MNSNYASQDRGGKQDYRQYLEAMDAISIEKVASASVFFAPEKGNVLVDVGMASGTSTAILAGLFPDLQVIGVDINPKMVEIARKQYQLPNLSFRMDDGEALDSFEKDSVDGFFNCSAIHHITSYNGYDTNRALNTLRRQSELLKERGILVVRDFVKPEEKEVILELSATGGGNVPSDSDLLLLFAKTARSLAPAIEQGFPVEELEPQKEGKRRFRLFYTDAVEFIRRKDYYGNWDIELQEEYGYLTQREFEDLFRSLGLRIILSAPIYNPWIIENRYKGRFVLYDLSGKEIGFPPTNYLIAGEKVSTGKDIRLVRHLPLLETPYLNFVSFRHKETGQIYDIVKRPEQVTDFLLYSREGNRLTVLARHGYPRPLANFRTGLTVIDGKYFGGYIPEGLAIGTTDNIEQQLKERFGIGEEQYAGIEQSLSYYTSPAGICEKVNAFLVALKEKPDCVFPLRNGIPGFQDFGSLQPYDAAQLLNTAQTGALAEARLELNIYRLFQLYLISLPKWLGEKITVKEETSLSTVTLPDLLKRHTELFIQSENPAGFLSVGRAHFMETGAWNSKVALEYVYPASFSANTLITFPVCRVSGHIFVGLEVRDLPVPQLFGGNSSLITVPAWRLLKEIGDFSALYRYMEELKIGRSSVIRYFRLGEKYFPSVGITPEQVYPYVVWLNEPDDSLAWVDLEELYTHAGQLEDAHLLICLYRLKHALADYNSK